MRKYIAISTFILVFVLAACSDEEEVTPEERLDDYVTKWNEQSFSDMYDMLADETKTTYGTEDYVDRYQKIYQDLDVNNLTVSFEVPTEEDQEEETNDTEEAIPTATFPLQVEMDTVAGPISFESDITLVQLEKEEQKNWYVEWDPGFIFPELKDGGDIVFETTTPARGQIFDQKHNGLAVNEVIYQIGVVPGEFGENGDETKQKIAELLEMDVAAIDNALGASWVKDDTFVPLKKVPTSNKELLEQLFAFEPVYKQDTTGRLYPLGKAAAHLVGYIGKITAEELEDRDPDVYSQNDLIGKRGLEQLYEERLKGQKGLKILVRNEGKDDVLLAEKPVEHGENITLTIDADIQRSIYTAYQDDAGTAAAIDPKSGEVLALVSSPAFDPNQITYGISQTAWEELQNDPQTPLINRFAANFSPGSTIKPITSAIGLEAGAIVPGEGIDIDGLTWSKDGWGNYQVRRVSESSGPVDVTDALIRSDNIFFARKAIELGDEAFVNGLKTFGLGEEFPFTYPIEQSQISSDGSLSREILLADSGYGQGEMEMSALHLATAYTPFLNDGKMIKPILDSKEDNGQVWKDNIVSSENVQVIKDALRQVVAASNGTARGANMEDIKLSGKTGTSELKSSQDEDGQENGWFVSYPEQEDIIIAMMVEHVEEKSGGSGYVVNKVADIFREIR
ncbi:penicillin-binding transpeptidase domain-containing protein [Aquibacillus koreensis]|uniref:serine-type D-Ala-D-Ala carboxypeptidase n=1 Tax=Aquibacillus koreensis TaxID=279446 RepID=A0A9X4AKN5_9BACI|nr:penicillin-binding transpeptidase domain-containing protein [Aquibacillus koreensis]MCT2537235.1 penicillin-binding transpeptidase domain-containing protein [Aquibacillus koreensis]MDC3421583.1 penicillin-binding transpeptidase domain-containing protein [Aquibacillus koreensis]